jgi:hypothetical protein
MTWRTFLAVIAACFMLAFTGSAAQAQANRTWVSGVGDDLNPCSRTAPCKTFAGAISKTAAGGEIDCLDPGGFGAVTINKSITIDCVGQMGGILAAGTNGIIVNAAGIIVNLRNLSINGGPPGVPGVNGIRVIAAASVNVENVRILNFLAVTPNGFGITVAPTSGTTRLYVTNSIISSNGTATTGGGINIQPTGTGSVTAVINGVELSNNFRGIVFNASGTTAASGTLAVRNTTIFHATENGITVQSGANGLVATFDNVSLSNNATAISLSGAGVLGRLGRSTITYNGTAVASSGGAGLQSLKDNIIDLNSNNSTPLPTLTPQ